MKPSRQTVVMGSLLLWLISSFLWVPSCAMAKQDLGVWGQTFPVIEPDVLQFIQQRLKALQQSGQLKQLESAGQQSAKQRLLNPTPLAIPLSHQNKITTYRPVYTLHHAVWLDAEHHYPAGTTIQPLKAVHFHTAFIFIDGRQAKQLAFARCEATHYQFVKIILTAGNIVNAMRQLGRVYYDQTGDITQHLHVKATPTIVTQQQAVWHIHQFSKEALDTACVPRGEKKHPSAERYPNGYYWDTSLAAKPSMVHLSLPTHLLGNGGFDAYSPPTSKEKTTTENNR